MRRLVRLADVCPKTAAASQGIGGAEPAGDVLVDTDRMRVALIVTLTRAEEDEVSDGLDEPWLIGGAEGEAPSMFAFLMGTVQGVRHWGGERLEREVCVVELRRPYGEDALAPLSDDAVRAILAHAVCRGDEGARDLYEWAYGPVLDVG